MKTWWIGTAASVALLSAFLGAQDRGVPSGDGGVPADAAILPGLMGSYWTIGEERTEFPLEVTCDEPGARRIDTAINFDPKEGRGFGDLPWHENFAVIWTGSIRLPASAVYSFYLRSRDPSKLYLDGDLILDHDGVHPLKETKGATLSMKAGNHEIRLEHYQNRREGRCILAWTYDGVDRQAVPATAYWHRPQAGIDPGVK